MGPFTLALAYLHVQDAPDGMMTFFFFTIRRKYLPGCMLLATFLMAGPPEAMKQALGLVAAHLYDFLTRIWPSYGGGVNPISTPRIVQQWFARPAGANTQRAYGTAFQSRSTGAQSQGQASRSGGWTSGFTSGSWGSRGAGRRLGGD
jgi:Derlin-2/3